jgi:hypothetical protein
MLGVVLRPENADEGITAVRATWVSKCQIDQQSDPLRLRQDATKLLSFGASKIQRSQGEQADQLPLPCED